MMNMWSISMASNFELAPVPRLSYNGFMEQFGGTMEDFSLHSLAYMLQCRQDTLDAQTRAEWEERLMDTRFNLNRPETEEV